MLNFSKTRILAPKPTFTANFGSYITAIAWSDKSSGKSSKTDTFKSGTLAVATDSGEVRIIQDFRQSQILQTETGASIDCLSFNETSDFLAAAGQAGTVKIWKIADLDYAQDFGAEAGINAAINAAININCENTWVDFLAWQNQLLAYSFGKKIQVYNLETRTVETTLDFENSGVQALTWQNHNLVAAGYQAVKIWHALDWQREPFILPIATAITAMAGQNKISSKISVKAVEKNSSKTLEKNSSKKSSENPHKNSNTKTIVIATADETVIFLDCTSSEISGDLGQGISEEFELSPFQLRGFPSKIKAIAWADQDPIFALASGAEITVWQPHDDPNQGWKTQVFNQHTSGVNALEFQPHSRILASADSKIWLSKDANALQTLDVNAEITCLKWHPSGQRLAAGTEDGQVLVWEIEPKSGKGFW